MFYGTTGQVGDGGVVFSYDKNSGAETTLYSFGNGNAAGMPLIYSHGLLYGTESGNHENVFSLNPSNDTETTIYTFTNYPDGVGPDFGVIMIDGIFYGVTHFGGHGEPGLGVVFKYGPSNGEYTVLHRFRGNKDGSLPLGPLTYRRGSLYGTTSYGGAGSGTIFKINPTNGRIDTLYTFTGGADGAAPNSQLFYENGAFYGTTAGGGVDSCNSGCGTVFKFTPGP